MMVMNDKERKAKAAAYMREWNRKNAERINAHRRAIREPITKICLVCGKSFQAVINIVTCGETCRKIRDHESRLRAKINYRNDPENRKKEAAHMRERRKEKEVKEREAAYKQRKEYKAQQREYQKKFREENPELVKRRAKDWAADHPFQARKGSFKRMELLANDPPIGKTALRRRLRLFGECCFCGRDGALTVEHLRPLSKGGRHKEKNILGACKRCNSSKGKKPWRSWFRKQPFHAMPREYFIALACEAA